eukprot:2323963-Pyramimonas_sp.AAC.1
MITANVGGQLGLDAYLCECIASGVFLVQETRIPASSVEPTESRLRQTGWSASLTAALPTLGNPTGGLTTATPKRIGLGVLESIPPVLQPARASIHHVGGMIRG